MNDIAKNNDIFTFTSNRLKNLFQNSPEFNRQFLMMFNFYHSKFEQIIQEGDKAEFEQKLFDSTKSQFFNGYFIIRELFAHEETSLDENVFKQPEGFITNQIPGLIRDLVGENFEEIITTEEMHALIMWGITKYEDILSLLKETAFDILCLGARQAIFDERDAKGLSKSEVAYNGLMGDVYDNNFLNPQLFLSPSIISTDSEVWNINWWDSLKRNDYKAGEITIIVIPSEANPKYSLRVYLSNKIQKVQQENLLDSILQIFKSLNNISEEDIVLDIAIIEEFSILVQE